MILQFHTSIFMMKQKFVIEATSCWCLQLIQAGWYKVKVPLFRQKPYKIFGREIYIKGGVVCNTRDSIIWSSLCTGHEPNFWSGSTNTWDSAVYRFYDSKNMNHFRYLLLSTKSALCLQFFRKILELKNILSERYLMFWHNLQSRCHEEI